jgi:hypothetical protein
MSLFLRLQVHICGHNRSDRFIRTDRASSRTPASCLDNSEHPVSGACFICAYKEGH